MNGQSIVPTNLDFKYIPRECNKVLWYEIIDGSLPPGLEMTSLGRIQGVLPNMDCTDENVDLSPSQNWYYHIDNNWQPWGRQWRFLVKIWISDAPETFDEQWFCVRIHNNWSWDRDIFNPPFEYDEIEYEVDFPISPLSLDLCCEPEPEQEPFVPVIIPQICSCDNETHTEQSIHLNFLQWYKNVLLDPPGELNPDIQNFIDNFKETDYFKQLMIQSGLAESLYTREELEIKAVESRIAYYTSQLNTDGRRQEDIDNVMLILKDGENQKLPITIEGYHGTTIYCEVI